MPDSIAARKQYWMQFLEEEMQATPQDVIIGWSSGAVCAMRYAETHKISALILIGPHYNDLGYEDEKLSGYFDDPWDWESIRNNVGKTLLFHGDNGPYIPTQDFKFIAKSIDALAYEVPNGAHFESIEEVPGLIDAIKENFR